MGSFLSWVRPGPLFRTLCPGEQPQRPSYRACDDPPAPQFQSPASRLPCGVQHRGRPVDLRWHGHLAEQARHWFLGIFASVFWRGHQKPVATIPGYREPCSSVILNVASAKIGHVSLHLLLERSVLTLWDFLTGRLASPRGKETHRSSLEKTSQGQAKEEKEASTPGASGEGLASKKESLPVSRRQWGRGRDRDGSVRTRSAFTRLTVNGALASSVPRPGPLNRDFRCNNSSACLDLPSHTSSKRRSGKRNAIASSCTSTSGLLPKRNGAGDATPADTRLRDPASCQFQVPAGEASAHGHQPSTSASVIPQSKTKHEKAKHGPPSQQQTPRNLVPSSGLRKPGKRKIPLLLPSKRDVPVILPAVLELGFRVTVEVYDSEKRAAMEQLNRFLMDDGARGQSN